MLGKWLGKNRTTTGPATTDRSAPVSVPVDAAAGAGAGSVWTPERALRALEEQRALCEKLDQLSLAQRTLIEGGRADALVELLTQRQVVIDRLDALSRHVEPLREGREGALSSLAAADRARVDELLEFVAASTERVRSRDDQDRAALERQRADVTRELVGMARSRGAMAAYGTPGPPAAPTYHDRQG